MNGKQFSSFHELKASGAFKDGGNDGEVPENEENGGENTRYSTVSYNSSKKEDPENVDNQKNFKTYYDKNRKPKVHEDLYSDYKIEEKKPEDSTLITTIRPRKTKEESYLPSQEYLAHLKNKENKTQRTSRNFFAKLFPKDVKPEDKREGEFSGDKTLDQMGFVINKKDKELQEVVYKEVEVWRNRLSELHGNKKKDERNKKELEAFNKNPYEWTKIAISNQLNNLKNDLEKTDNKNSKKFIKEKIVAKEKILNSVINAIQKEIPLQIDSDFLSETITLGENELDTTIAIDEINKLANQKSAHYTIVGVIMRGKNKFVVLKNEKGERVDLLMEDAKRLAKETNFDFKKTQEKEARIGGLESGDIIKVRTEGVDVEKATYKIEIKKDRVFFENLDNRQKGSMNTKDMRAFLMDKSREFIIEKNEEHKNRDALKSLEYFSEKIEGLKIRQTIGRRKASPEEKARIWKEQLALLGFGNVNVELAGQIDDTAENEKIEQQKNKRFETIKQIENILRKNNMEVSKVVIHGYSFENEKGELLSHWDTDTDTRGALYMLQLAGVRYKSIEKTHKGGKIEHKPGEIVIYLDTGHKTLSVEHENGGVQIAFDHHQKEYPGDIKTSATKEAYETMVAGGFIKRELRLDRLAEVVNQEDNLSYVDNKRFNENYFKYKYSSSLFALQKEVDFKHLIKWTKEGKDPFDPKFSPQELKELVRVLDTIDGEKKFIDVPLEAVIGKIQESVLKDVSAITFAMRKMKERSIKTETRELGKVVYNFPDFQVVGKNKKYLNKFRYPFVAIKAFGYDTYASYSELTKKGFLSNSTHDLTFINQEISEEIPGSNMINGVMILPPKTKAERSVGSEDKFLRAIKLKE